MNAYVIGKGQLPDLFERCRALGYDVIAPTLEDGVIRLAPLGSAKELAMNVVTVQSPGKYRTESSDLVFSFTHGPDSPKRFLYPPQRNAWHMAKTEKGFEIRGMGCKEERIAFFGIKSCDLASIEVLDRTLMKGEFKDEQYVKMRSNAAIVVANCINPSGTCFCSSMGTGPRATHGFDLALTELGRGFLVEAGTEVGEEMLNQMSKRGAEPSDLEEAKSRIKAAEARMGRTLDTTDLRDKLYASLESQAFKEVTKRCLGCANCTSVCPTCFCTMVQDVPSLDGRTSDRQITWDSCFNYQFAQVAGGHFRPELWARYRQWMTHKFAYWLDQFDTFGCIGCGRCITWCPVGIDVIQSVKDAQVMK